MEFITSWFTVNTRLQEIGDTQIQLKDAGYTDTLDTQIQLENTQIQIQIEDIEIQLEDTAADTEYRIQWIQNKVKDTECVKHNI